MTARRCVRVGYGTEVKGYRLYDPSSRKVFYSCDVRFNESEIGYEKEVKPVEPVAETEPYVELDVSDDHDLTTMLKEHQLLQDVQRNHLPSNKLSPVPGKPSGKRRW